MAPEHLRALVGRTPALIRQVDGRSDIYSLGMVLAEMLTGHRPFEQSGSYSAVPLQIEAMALERSKADASVRRDRPDLSWGLESIVRKCLAADPAARYQQADHLADDLRRLLDDRPLKHAPELSRVEQVRKFARRHPRLASAGSVAGAAVLVLLADRLGAWRRPAPSWPTTRRATWSATTTRACSRRSAWSTPGWICTITSRRHRGLRADARPVRCPRGSGLDAAQDLGPAGPGGSPPTGRGSSRAAPAPGRCEGPAGRGVEGLRRAGPAAARRAESIPGLPPSRALWLDRARYWSLRRDDGRAAEAAATCRADPGDDRPGSLPDRPSLARQGGPEGLQGRHRRAGRGPAA